MAERTGRGFALRRKRTGQSTSPAQLARVLQTLEGIQQDFNRAQSGGKRVQLADLIVLGGSAAVAQAAEERRATTYKVPFTTGRTDASQEQTDVEAFAVLEPTGRRVPQLPSSRERCHRRLANLAGRNLLTLTAPEMTVLVGGLRVLRTPTSGTPNTASSPDRPETLTNDFFVHLLDMNTEWNAFDQLSTLYEGRARATGEFKGDRHRGRPRFRCELPTPSYCGGVRV